MVRKFAPQSTPDPSATDAALDAMDAEELRTLIHDIIPWLDESTHARLANAIIDRAARNASNWVPAAPTKESVADIVSFAEAAVQTGYAEPSDIADCLRQGSNAFLARGYATAGQIFRAILPPLGDGEVYLGESEMIDEVLGVDVAACAAQYAVAAYMNAAPLSRAEAVLAAIDEVGGMGHFWKPQRELEGVAVETLPGFEEFLADWRTLIEKRVVKERQSGWDFDAARWRREVVQRLEGIEGLGRVAHSTKSADDLRAWCRALVDAGDWKQALSAYDKAAEIVRDGNHYRGEFLDGAALAAQELGRKDLPARLESAWREAPSMVRLRRWLGLATNEKRFRERASAALDACPKDDDRQRGLLQVLLNDFAAAAKLLAHAPGLGWSNSEHPGHLLFPLFTSFLSGTPFDAAGARDFEEIRTISESNAPRLAIPEIASLIALTDVTVPENNREAILDAMRRAAEKRIAGVTKNKRRRHYSHAAGLALTCVRIDPNGSAAWMTRIRSDYKRYPALQRELAERGQHR